MTNQTPINKGATAPARKKSSIEPTATPNSKALYVTLSIIIVGLVGLIGWFIYLLITADSEDETAVKNTNTEIVTTTNTNVNTNYNYNTNTKTVADLEPSLNIDDTELFDLDEKLDKIEDTDIMGADDLSELDDKIKKDELKDDEENADDTKTSEEGETITLYFPTSTSDCGEVQAVERTVELGDDPYGETILTMMHGPNSDESDYSDGIPASVGLRQVEYTADGALITVNEGYNDLDSCTQQTVNAQFIETANAMFDLPAGTSGTVEVGTVEDEESDDSKVEAVDETE
ncbi:MAG: hypothetical protein Q8P90_00625 [bacterium]|nr:hypothetical protein [bacterium]